MKGRNENPKGGKNADAGGMGVGSIFWENRAEVIRN